MKMKTLILTLLIIAFTVPLAAQSARSRFVVSDSLKGNGVSTTAMTTRGYGQYKTYSWPGHGNKYSYPLESVFVQFALSTDSISFWGGNILSTATAKDTVWTLIKLKYPRSTINTGAGGGETRDTVVTWFSPMSNPDGALTGRLVLVAPSSFAFIRAAMGRNDTGYTRFIRTLIER